MSSWLEPAIDPLRLVRTALRGNKDPRAGLAVLLSGDLPLYQRIAGDAGWPLIGSRADRNASCGHALLAAVGLHLANLPAAGEAYDELLSAQADSSFLTILAVLRGLRFADQGDLGQARDALRARLEITDAPLERALLLLHTGVTEMERNDLAAALEATALAKAEPSPRVDRSAHRALRVIAAHNHFHFTWLSGMILSSSDLPLRGTSPTLLRGSEDEAAALAAYLAEQFENLTADPNSRSITIRAADPTELALFSSVWRAQCLADWGELKHTRGLLGRYYVASRLGTPDGVIPEAFSLLRRSGDAKVVRAAARSVAAVGPLAALQSEVGVVLQLPQWPLTQRSAILALLEPGADLLTTRQADRALAHLRTEEHAIVADPSNGLGALAQIVRVCSDRAQTSASRFSRTLIEKWPENPLLVQDMARVIAALRWSAVSLPERKAWVSFVETHIAASDSRRLLAENVAGALADVEREEIARVLVRAYDKEPTLIRLALITDAQVELSGKRRHEATALAMAATHGVRASAHKGTYGLGAVVDPAVLLLALIARSPRDPGWDELVEFLIDERVAVSDKSRVLDRLADPRVSIPQRAREQLRDHIDGLAGFLDPLGPTEASLRGRILRLWLRLGGIRRDETLARLLALTGDLDRGGRLEGAITLTSAQRQIGDDVAFTLALSLTRDRDYTVRAQGGRALARLRREKAGELTELAFRRLELLISETGTTVPAHTLSGLVESSRNGQTVHPDLLRVVRRVSRIHPSSSVRRLAEQLLTDASAALPKSQT